MQRIMFGDVEVIRVMEAQVAFTPARVMVPGSSAETWQGNESWLAPDFWRPEDDMYVAALQTWVLRSEGRTVLVDTGLGRHSLHRPAFGGLRTNLVEELAAAGVKAEDVDVVVNTHLHADHVGWNTTEQGGALVPTFPNARYLIPALDHAFYGPGGPHGGASRDAESQRRIFEESVRPVSEAGQAVLWEGGHRLDGNLVLEPAPGHTPGSSVLRLESAGERAVFVGDILHSPVQVLEPDCNSCFCEDAEQARATRRAVLERAADNREIVIPAHFGGDGAVEVRRAGSRFAVSRWA